MHELGHVFEAKRQGLPVSAPMFIPFLGALIVLKELPDNAWNEAKVAIAGPILGGLGAAAVWGLGEYLTSDLLVALAFTGFFLNLFNLAPVSPLDGGRSLRSTVALVRRPDPAARHHNHRPEPDHADPLPRRARVLAPLAEPPLPRGRGVLPGHADPALVTGVSYIVLAALLALGMSGTFVERDI